nr:MAG TPA: hypothetical protein [Caudoviricetes sp.]
MDHRGPFFCVTDVTNVTRNGGGPKKVVQWSSHVLWTFPWNCSERSRVDHFYDKTYID